MLPQSFTERMQGLLGSEYEEFLASFEHEKYQALRLNPLKRDDMSVITEKVKQTFQLQPVPWAENGYYYTKEDQPGKHPWHEAGLYYIQEPSAMAPVTLLSPQPGATVRTSTPCEISRLALVWRKLWTFKSSGRLLAFKISLKR